MSAPRAPVRPEDFPARASQDGRIAWFLGFLGLLDLLVLVGVPALGYVTMSLGLVAVGLLQRRNPVARGTGRRAALLGSVNLAVLAALLLRGLLPPATTAAAGEAVEAGGLPLLVIWVFSGGSLFGVALALLALLVPVSRTRATTVLARAAARRAGRRPARPPQLPPQTPPHPSH
ncbi:hypothetical protein ACT3TZ_12450 [Brachybacterium sp. AOP25-B2-12]|uniref:hypothetical protein n=1 Tax=Brachybacterium sp. AOP25-B2-12 TaxID=3457710 RepID=UPI0040337C76